MEHEIRTEGQRLADRLLADEVPLRFMGGLGIWLRSPSVRRPPFERPYLDLDLVAASQDRVGVQAFLEGEGYVPDKRFNTLHGAQRLYYAAPHGAWSVDVIFDRLAMSHVIDLRDRLASREATLPLADLLLTKLQIWEINRKDIIDALCLIADHPLGDDVVGSIGVARITSVLRSDWGFCQTAVRNLDRIGELAGSEQAGTLPRDVGAEVAALREAIVAAPKTIAWKARARIGGRIRWYETPEEVGH